MGTIRRDKVLELTLNDSTVSTTYEIIPHNNVYPNGIINLVRTEVNGRLKSLEIHGYMMDPSFAHAYHEQGAPLTQFKGGSLVFTIYRENPCENWQFHLIVTEEEYFDYNNPIGGGIGGIDLGGMPNSAWGYLGAYGTTYTSFYSGGGGKLLDSSVGSGLGNGGGGGFSVLVSDVVGAVGDAVGDAWNWLSGLFGGCSCGPRPELGGPGTKDGTDKEIYEPVFTIKSDTVVVVDVPEAPDEVSPCAGLVHGILHGLFSSDYYLKVLQISSEDFNYLMFTPNKDFSEAALDFLIEEGFSQEALDFFHAAIEAHRNDAEVDFDEIIINELTGKAKCVYNKLNQNGTSFADAIKKFDGKFPVAHLRFAMDYDLPNSTNAVTDNDYQYLIEIRINGNTLNGRTSLGLARTLAHETIHAELFRKVRSVGGTISINDFPGIYDYYRRYVKGWQHQQMAAHYRETIVDILKEFDNNSHSDQFYNDLAWEGLQGTMAWNNLSDSEQQNIINTVVNYKKNGNKTCN